MGMAFPIGMQVASEKFREFTPWFWGINGACSVCASVVAVAITISFGISVAFWIGLAFYGVSFFFLMRSEKNGARILETN